MESGFPRAEGLYDPRYEHDACGVGFVVHIKGVKSHEIVSQGIQLLVNLEHCGAAGAEANSGDGAGILTQIPHKFFAKKAGELGFKLPEAGDYGVGQLFLPMEKAQREAVRALFVKCATECGQEILGWRSVPTYNGDVGESVKSVEPAHEQVFFRRGKDAPDAAAFERKLYVVRKYAERSIRESAGKGLAGAGHFYCGSLSCRTIVYKGLFTSTQVLAYFPDLTDADFESALALVHSRFSTNTFPTWPLAHPFRYLAHNGEINTLRGNENWMRARESLLESSLFTADEIRKLLPIIDPAGSDSAKLDNVVELLVMGGRSLPHVMMMLIPEAWEKDPEMSAEKRAFYEYHGTIMEPWDGPASVAFTDGEIIGATLDRNGLRPSRYQLTKDDILVMGSEAGVLRFPPESIVLKGRLQPGRMFVVSLAEGRIIPDEEIKHRMAVRRPYGEWLKKGKIDLANLSPSREIKQPAPETVLRRQKFFGYTLEDLKILMAPMVNAGEEALGSMGNDAALAVLSDKSRNLFDYFHQLFAQVTNPPIDKDREEMVMSLTTFVGKEDNLLEETPDHCRTIELPHPVLTNDELERLRWVDKNHFQARTIPIVFKAEGGEGRMEKALERIRQSASDAVQEGYNVLVLSDRPVDSGHAAIPSLLAVSAVHHHLIRAGLRARCGLVVETGEAREVHHFALLLGYGASAINPYLAFETVEDMRRRKLFKDGLTLEKAEQHYVKAVNKGLLKVISKMGISTIQSYIGAQIFEAVGLGNALVDEYFTGTASRIGGIDVATLEEETLVRHRFAYPGHEESPADIADIEVGGQYQWRQRGERHMLTPDVVHKLQHAVRMNSYKTYEEYAKLIDDQGDAPLTLRGLLDFAGAAPIPLEEVEPAEGILKRFASGAMSFGSISWEAHTTLAMAMNRIGARSNTGEGGEDPLRFKPLPNGDSMRSSIKQVASGRFGVTSEYLVNADELQIKMAQGAKPGEGGQLPGWKVDKFIAKTRHSTQGVGLISPPPHHDIYSIEDLAQLIYDLKNSNDRARISVKLVAEVGVGTVAAGVAKAHSDVILIAGYDGGTGASPQTSIKHAGLPWELGLSEAHQVLIKNGLRSRVVLQTDGMLRTGRDIAIATLLGAEEWGVATGGLVAMGCIMMRKCHLNTCPVGIATQDPDLRKLFPGEVEHVVNFYRFLAEDMRRHMAALGFRTVDEMVGRVDRLAARRDVRHWKAKHLDLGKILHGFGTASIGNMHCCDKQDHGLEKSLDWKLMEAAGPALESGKPVKATFEIRNVHRTVGTILSSNVTRAFGAPGLPEDTIHFKFNGSAGQSFGAFAAPGVTLELEGEANDYFGKGLSGAKLILYPPAVSTFVPADNVIVGNVSFYGATSGQAYIRGKAGERFCVRNSGVEVVAESCGDHGCEYMTGGRVVLLGETGRNFAAGMSGGIAYLFDPDARAASKVNPEMVDLEEITEAEEAIDLKGRIEKHLEYTGSAAAKDILADWKNSLRRFVKVMPRDYKRAMAEKSAETMAKG